MDNLNAISILEETLEYSSQLDDLERKFDEVYPNFDNSQDYLSSLRQIKIFLGREKEFRYCLLKDTKLKGSDCLTMAILAAILANRKGYTIMNIEINQGSDCPLRNNGKDPVQCGVEDVGICLFDGFSADCNWSIYLFFS